MVNKVNKNPLIPEQIKTSKYAEYFSHLQEITEKQDRELTFSRILIQILEHDHHKKIQQILKELLVFFKNEAYSSIRIIINKNTSYGIDNQIKEGIGPKSDDYEYLDNQVQESLGKSGILYISDTSKIHSIKFKEGFQFPKTILGFTLNSSVEKTEFIWFACEEKKDFSKVESDMLASTIEACSKVIANCIEWNFINSEKNTFRYVLDAVNLPIFLMLREKIIFSNLISQNIFKEYLDASMPMEKLIGQIQNVEAGNQKSITLNQRNFHINIIEVGQEFRGSLKAVVFMDETILEKQRDYISLIIETICQSLKLPLNLILGTVKMLPLVGELNEHQKKYISDIKDKTDDSLLITKELLDLERIIKNNGLNISGNKVKNIVDHAAKLVTHLAKQKQIKIELQQSTITEMIWVDRTLFTQLITNVLEFAISKTSLGGIININFTSQKENWRITINDCSNGLPQVDLDKYNTFERLSEIPPGLLLVRSIIKFHGGIFNIQSEPGKGNTYIVEVPKNLQN